VVLVSGVSATITPNGYSGNHFPRPIPSRMTNEGVR